MSGFMIYFLTFLCFTSGLSYFASFLLDYEIFYY